MFLRSLEQNKKGLNDFLPSAIFRNKFCDLHPSSLMVTPVWIFSTKCGYVCHIKRQPLIVQLPFGYSGDGFLGLRL